MVDINLNGVFSTPSKPRSPPMIAQNVRAGSIVPIGSTEAIKGAGEFVVCCG